LSCRNKSKNETKIEKPKNKAQARRKGKLLILCWA